MQKIYCYIDETGQDTNGKWFLVSALIFGNERDQAEDRLIEIENKSGRERSKWTKSNEQSKIAYLEAVLSSPLFEGCLYYAIYENSKDYLHHLAQTAETAIRRRAEGEYKANIIVDGLETTPLKEFGALMRSFNIQYDKLRGPKDETTALLRLADTVCGLARAGLRDEHSTFKPMFERAVRTKHIAEI